MKASLCVVDPANHPEHCWKNGLGATTLLYHYPTTTESTKDDVYWKICEKRVKGDCSLAVSPEFEIGLVALPADKDTPKNTVGLSSAVIRHNDEENIVPLTVSSPHIYDGAWPTVLSLPSVSTNTKNIEDVQNSVFNTAEKEFRYISVWANKKRADMSITVENLCRHELDDESEKSTLIKAVATSKLLFSHFTVFYVMKGSVLLTLDEKETLLGKGKYAIVQQQSDSEPTDIKIEMQDNDSDAVLVTIQINLKPALPRTASSAEFHLANNRLVRTMTGSLIVYDDQPTAPPEAKIDISVDPHQKGTLAVHHFESARHYHPPLFTSRYKNESQVPPPMVRDSFNVQDYPVGTISTAWINMVKQGLSEWIRLPVIVARGVNDGPVVGFTAVVHGNELNGVPCIHRVITDIDVNKLNGTVVAIPCVNVPGYLRFSREFSDGKDLNRQFPGKIDGTPSQIFAYHLLNKIISKFNYLIDLHTASFGRVNSYYVRADMNDPVSAAFAKLQQPQIILHNSGQDGTLRSECMVRSIKSITVEIGNPQQFQNQFVQWSYQGAMRILNYLNMFYHNEVPPLPLAPSAEEDKRDTFLKANSVSSSNLNLSPAPSTILCSKGFWIYTNTGGVLEVYPQVNTIVKKGALIARIKNIFGNIVCEIYCPQTGITIGRSSNPVAMAGDRVLHLGVIKRQNEVLAGEAKENY